MATEPIRQFFVIHAKQMQHRGGQFMIGDRRVNLVIRGRSVSESSDPACESNPAFDIVVLRWLHAV